ncbi:siderophore-interacting protein [Ramlibacter sp. USB13]|uniref:Siderophore-interacting protein n=1 Tax=Ramlibacter cellulosilyticus TaxID=2764187 RepID=A0A923SBF0_9BURK|nr:siderophore-interacting protein [Ramlibacter cellulosilyticus]MBC5783821.1 siderophore-interacting protein [Ramlibacter cellulosilyticus]
MESPAPTRRVERVRHELRRRALEVVRTERLGPGFVSITFGGEELDGFVSASFDDHVKFMLGEGTDDPVRRDYTPRRYDAAARELTIEFAVHAHGRTSDWARQARVGDRVLVGGPRGSFIVPLDYDWHLLAGDATALPAIRRRLEELPAGARAIVLAQVEPGDRVPFVTQAKVDVYWVDTPEALLDAVSGLELPQGEGFAWAGGEAAVMAALRGILREQHGLAKEQMRIAAYWKRGASAHHENLED